jgi:RNA polymerase sigma-70 factor (ECF subfamily)
MNYSSLSCDELVRACVDTANAEAWQEFIHRFHPVISGAIWCIARRHRDNNSETVAELVQDTYYKFCADNCRLLRRFKPYHEYACHAWVKVVAMNVARDHYRPSSPAMIADDISELENLLVDSRASNPSHLERRLLIDKIDSILGVDCSPRDKEIFWLYYGSGLTAAEIAKIPHFNLTEKGVESVIHRLTALVRRKLAEERENGEGPDKAA